MPPTTRHCCQLPSSQLPTLYRYRKVGPERAVRAASSSRSQQQPQPAAATASQQKSSLQLSSVHHTISATSHRLHRPPLPLTVHHRAIRLHARSATAHSTSNSLTCHVHLSLRIPNIISHCTFSSHSLLNYDLYHQPHPNQPSLFRSPQPAHPPCQRRLTPPPLHPPPLLTSSKQCSSTWTVRWPTRTYTTVAYLQQC